MSDINLHDTMDARVWAKEWLKTIEKNPSIPADEGAMIGWFANAIMVGFDTCYNRYKFALTEDPYADMKQAFPESCQGDGRPLAIGAECGWATNQN